jgi:hypothetical protein
VEGKYKFGVAVTGLQNRAKNHPGFSVKGYFTFTERQTGKILS